MNMSKLTKVQCERLVDEIIDLQEQVDRYKEIQGLLKENLPRFKDQAVVTEKGRAFMTVSEQITIPPEAADEVLGPELASKVVVVKRSVSNKQVEAFLAAGDIEEVAHVQLLAQAKRKPRVSLYVRPLN
jgi:hypothetical protein